MELGQKISRNPYFIGINSAIILQKILLIMIICRNPYFIGINSAMQYGVHFLQQGRWSQSLFYWN